MLKPPDVVSQALWLHTWATSERGRLDVIRQYWKGRQKLPAVIPEAAPREVREMARMSRVNICEIVVNSLTQSLFVDGYRTGRPGRATSDENLPVWQAWQANRLDKWQTAIIRPTAAYGTGYSVVIPGQPYPVVRPVSPRKMFTMYGEDPDWPLWALERTSVDTYRLYDTEAVYFLGREQPLPGEYQFRYIEARKHGLGVCPVVRFQDEVDLDAEDEVDHGEEDHVLGQIAPLMKLQDQIDFTTFNLLVAQHYSAFRQRYILGWVAETEAERLQASASRMWTFDDHPDEIEIGELSQTTLDGYIASREATIRHAAALSQTPTHELIADLVNLSADALAAADAAKDRKIDERKTGLGESFEQVFALLGGMMGEEVPEDAQVVWRDTSASSFAAVVDGLGKLAQMLGIPPQELWERVPGATQQDVVRWKAAAERGDSMAWLADLVERQAGELV
jgi:hypothetical protein